MTEMRDTDRQTDRQGGREGGRQTGRGCWSATSYKKKFTPLYSDLHFLQAPPSLYRTMCPEYISLLLFSVVIIISAQPFIALYVYSNM